MPAARLGDIFDAFTRGYPKMVAALSRIITLYRDATGREALDLAGAGLHRAIVPSELSHEEEGEEK